MDPYKLLYISTNPDGSLARFPPFPFIPPSLDPDSPFLSLSRDLPLNPSNRTSLRLFLPKSSAAAAGGNKKLPVVFYFHGGGFVLSRTATSFYHLHCSNLAAKLPALVLSLDYRLGPEHRLPAAYEDALDALLWLRNQALLLARECPSAVDPWVRDHADLPRCFLAGSSSGANMAFHLGRRLANDPELLGAVDPLVVDGLVLIDLFIGGVERTAAEVRMSEDKILPLAAADLMWELALPEGAGRDHEYCNPVARKNVDARVEDAEYCKGMVRCLVRGYAEEPLVDRQRAAVEMLRRGGVQVVGKFCEDGYHAVEFWDAGKEEEMVDDVRKFVYGQGEGGGDCVA